MKEGCYYMLNPDIKKMDSDFIVSKFMGRGKIHKCIYVLPNGKNYSIVMFKGLQNSHAVCNSDLVEVIFKPYTTDTSIIDAGTILQKKNTYIHVCIQEYNCLDGISVINGISYTLEQVFEMFEFTDGIPCGIKYEVINNGL